MFILNESAKNTHTNHDINIYDFLRESVEKDMKVFQLMTESDVYELQTGTLNEALIESIKNTLDAWWEKIKETIDLLIAKLKNKKKEKSQSSHTNAQYDKVQHNTDRSLSQAERKELNHKSKNLIADICKILSSIDDIDIEESKSIVDDIRQRHSEIIDSVKHYEEILEFNECLDLLNDISSASSKSYSILSSMIKDAEKENDQELNSKCIRLQQVSQILSTNAIKFIHTI